MSEFLSLKIDFPSRYKFYTTFKEAYAKKLSIADYKDLIHVIKSKHDDYIFDGFKRILGKCCSIDINELTPWDFIYLMYYIREISFPKEPLIVTWVSHYGNLLQTKVHLTQLDITEPAITQDELNNFILKGYRVPKIKDIDAETFIDILANDLSKPGTNIYDHIEIFYQGNSTEDKIKFMEEYTKDMDLSEAVDEVSKFYALISHGIVEKIPVSDDSFNPNNWVKKLEKKIQEISDSISLIKDPTNMSIAIAVKSKLTNELTTLKETLEKGDSVKPITEYIFLPKGYEIFLPKNRFE